jgi:peptidase E
MKTTRHIVALGGGGFSMESDNTTLDDYILGLTKQKHARICFIGTASGDSQVYIDRFYKAFPKSRARASHLPLFSRDRKIDLQQHLLAQDVIYVGGGNTANLLAIWRLHGVDRILQKAWKYGIVLCGVSAGMNCWFESCVTDSFGVLAPLSDGLNFLRGSACPHYDGEADRRPAYRRLISTGKLPPGYAADDGAALHFHGQRLHAVISSRPYARAYRVERIGNRSNETPLVVRFLKG